MATPFFVIIFTIFISFYATIITLFLNIVNLDISNLKYHDFGTTLARFCSFPVKASMLYDYFALADPERNVVPLH